MMYRPAGTVNTKPPAQLIISRPNKTEDRFIRPRPKSHIDARPHGATNVDEEYRLVMDCPPYTASFNNLLQEKRSKENPHRLVKLVCDRMQAEGIPMNTTTYNLLMKRVGRYTDGVIFNLYEELKAEGTKPSCSVRPNAETFRLLFRACERGAEYNKAFLLYQQMRDLFNLLPDTPMFNTLLGYCAASKDVAQATYFVEEMKDNHVPLDVNTYNCLMSVLVETAPCKETLKVFTELTDNGVHPTVRTFNIVLKAARINDDYDRVFQFFEEMKLRGVIPDVTTYNTLFWMCQQRLDYVLGRGKYAQVHRTREQKLRGRASIADLVILLHEEMSAMGVQPNTFTYNKLLCVLVDCKNIRIFYIYQQVLELYTLYKKEKPVTRKGGAPEDLALSEAAVHQAVEDALVADDPREDGRICAIGVYPNRRTYHLMMLACFDMGPPEKCKFLYQHMITSGIVPDKEMMLLLLKVCQTLKDMEWADHLLQEAQKYRLVIDTIVYNHYLSVMALTSDRNMLLEEFDLMRLGINLFGAKADTDSYNIMMRWYGRANAVDEGLALFTRMCEGLGEEVVPNTETYCIMLELYAKTGDLETPLRIIQEYAKNSQAEPLGKEFYYDLMQCFSDNDDPRVVTLFNDIRSGSISPLISAASNLKIDERFYSILLSYYEKHKNYARMAETFSELKSSHTLDIDTAVYKSMFQMYHEKQDMKSINRLFDEARISRVVFDVNTYNVIFAALVETKDEFVYDVFRDMYENKIPPHETTLAIFMPTPEGRQILAKAIEDGLFYHIPTFTAF